MERLEWWRRAQRAVVGQALNQHAREGQPGCRLFGQHTETGTTVDSIEEHYTFDAFGGQLAG